MDFLKALTLAWEVVRKGLPKMTGLLKSSRMSSIIKSMGKINLSIFIRRFLTIPFGTHLELLASSLFILISSSFPIPRRLYIEKGTMLMLAPKSAKAFLKSNLPIEQGRIKLPGSFSFGGSWLRIRAEHLRFILTSSFSMVNGLLVTSSFIYLGYSSDCMISLRKGRFDLIFFRLSMVYGSMHLRHVVRAFWERELGERTVLYSGLLFVLERFVLNLRQGLM
ncbi:hypothetical protein Tco_1077423 [Tanacetum coccineum]